MSAVPFFALSEPIWLRDSSGVLVSGLPAGSGAGQGVYLPLSPVPLLDPASFRLDAAQVTALRVVRLDRHATSVSPTAFGHGAARPTTDAGGRFAYLRLEAAGAEAGSPRLTSALDDAGDRVMRDAGARAGFISFTPELEAMIISGVPVPGEVPATADGVWLLDLRTGATRQLSTDGWLPRWLP
jgi:hypothetical protein